MSFESDRIDEFLSIFAESSPKIRARPGCHHLELWRSQEPGNVLFTFSLWEGPNDLEAYRQSELFRTTWAKTKALFSERAEAWSVDVLERLP